MLNRISYKILPMSYLNCSLTSNKLDSAMLCICCFMYLCIILANYIYYKLYLNFASLASDNELSASRVHLSHRCIVKIRECILIIYHVQHIKPCQYYHEMKACNAGLNSPWQVFHYTMVDLSVTCCEPCCVPYAVWVIWEQCPCRYSLRY